MTALQVLTKRRAELIESMEHAWSQCCAHEAEAEKFRKEARALETESAALWIDIQRLRAAPEWVPPAPEEPAVDLSPES